MDAIYGLHAVDALIRTDPSRIKELHLHKGRQDQRIQALVALAYESKIKCVYHDQNYFDKHYTDCKTQGVVASISPKPLMTENDIGPFLEKREGPVFILILDGVTDPHNLGACLRCADATGVDLVIAPKDRAAGLTGIVSKVASGAAESVPFVAVTNLARVMDKLKEMGIWIYGLCDGAPATLYGTDFRGSIAIVVGAEGHGLRRLTQEKCDGLLHIPMKGIVSSLNVSVAAGVCLYEVIRQRTT